MLGLISRSWLHCRQNVTPDKSGILCSDRKKNQFACKYNWPANASIIQALSERFVSSSQVQHFHPGNNGESLRKFKVCEACRFPCIERTYLLGLVFLSHMMHLGEFLQYFPSSSTEFQNVGSLSRFVFCPRLVWIWSMRQCNKVASWYSPEPSSVGFLFRSGCCSDHFRARVSVRFLAKACEFSTWRRVVESSWH